MVKTIFMLLISCAGVALPKDYRIEPESFDGLKPVKPETWVTSDDYPEAAVQREVSGVVGVEIEVNRNGKVSRCFVNRSSGYTRLDNVPCRLLVRRARFIIPDGDVRSSYTGHMTFRITTDVERVPQ